MGSTINPRARGGSSLSAELKASRADRNQIRRLFNPTPKAAAPAVGGSMQGFTRAKGSATWGGGGVQVTDWTFDTSIDASPGGKPALTSDGTYFGPTEPGWYATHSQLQFTLGSGNPAGVLIQANNNSGNVSTSGEVWGMNIWDGRYRAALWCGPFWLDGSSMPLGLEARIPGSFAAGALSLAFVDVWRVG